MTLNVDLEDVPFAILDAVRERILRSRRNRQQAEPAPRPSLRPRPQQRKFGASSTRWVRPEPAATVSDQRRIAHLWAFTKLSEQRDKITSIISAGSGKQAIKEEDDTNFSDNLYADQLNIVKDSRSFSYGTTINLWEQQIDPGELAAGATPDRRYAVGGYDSCWGLGSNASYSIIQSWAPSNTYTHNVTVDKTYNPVLNADQQYLILPAGGDNCIVIYLWRADWYYNFIESATNPTGAPGRAVVDILPGASGTTQGRVAYVVSRDRCRSIQIPQKAIAVLDDIWPESVPHTASVTLNALNWSFVNVAANTGCPNQFLGWSQDDLQGRALYGIGTYDPAAYFGWVPWNWVDLQWSFQSETFTYPDHVIPEAPAFMPDKYIGLKAENPVTPSIFASLNTASQFVEPATIKQLPPSSKWIVEDPDSTPLQQKYGTYSIPGDPDDNEDGTVIPDNSLTFSLSEDRDQDFPDLESEEYYAIRYAIWDWDDPDYCRRMCLSLGFTAADLQA